MTEAEVDVEIAAPEGPVSPLSPAGEVMFSDNTQPSVSPQGIGWKLFRVGTCFLLFLIFLFSWLLLFLPQWTLMSQETDGNYVYPPAVETLQMDMFDNNGTALGVDEHGNVPQYLQDIDQPVRGHYQRGYDAKKTDGLYQHCTNTGSGEPNRRTGQTFYETDMYCEYYSPLHLSTQEPWRAVCIAGAAISILLSGAAFFFSAFATYGFKQEYQAYYYYAMCTTCQFFNFITLMVVTILYAENSVFFEIAKSTAKGPGRSSTYPCFALAVFSIILSVFTCIMCKICERFLFNDIQKIIQYGMEIAENSDNTPMLTPASSPRGESETPADYSTQEDKEVEMRNFRHVQEAFDPIHFKHVEGSKVATKGEAASKSSAKDVELSSAVLEVPEVKVVASMDAPKETPAEGSGGSGGKRKKSTEEEADDAEEADNQL